MVNNAIFPMKIFKNIIFAGLLCLLAFWGYQFYRNTIHEAAVLREVIQRLEADSRAAEVLVTDQHFDEETQKTLTTIKFLEFDTQGRPLAPRYFTFAGKIIQFQSLVIRFDDLKIRAGVRLKGKSAYLFWKVFMLDGPKTQEFFLTKIHDVPEGYRAGETVDPFEQRLWEEFWTYAFDPQKAEHTGIKNVQIEAPGSLFRPGYLYTIKIEHDGGLRIDVSELPSILKGEKIPE